MQNIRRALLTFYQHEQRVLPWRQTKDPYAIWVSEIMLQQTQVDTVIPRYHQFLKRFPTIETLANADETEVCEAWAGLGYYRRARHLAQAAKTVKLVYQNKLPNDVKNLLQLKGIGRYTAGAIASIAFGQAVPIVDGNVERVFARLFELNDLPKSTQGQKKLWAWAEELVQGERPGDLNQALMELGATVCTPVSPRCERCPISFSCEAYKNSSQEKYPLKTPAKEKKILHVAFALIQTSEGIWLEQRSLEGLWPGLWELPSAHGKDAKKQLHQRFCVTPKKLATIEHVLTHRQVIANIYRVETKLKQQKTLKAYLKPLEAPLSSLAKKALISVLPQ